MEPIEIRNCGKKKRKRGTPEALIKRFQFVCPKQWNQLQTTAHEDVRFCKLCRENVYFAHTAAQLATLARAGKCAAVEVCIANGERSKEPVGILGRPSPQDIEDQANEQWAGRIFDK